MIILPCIAGNGPLSTGNKEYIKKRDGMLCVVMILYVYPVFAVWPSSLALGSN